MSVKEKLLCTGRQMKFKISQKSPEILVGVGIVSTIAGVVLACKETLKVDDILDNHKETLDRIHEAAESGKTVDGREYTDQDAKKDTTVLYFKTGVAMAKNYTPAAIFVVTGITSFLASNNVLKKRNFALAATLTAVDTAFKDYRQRVIDRFGEEVDYQLKNNIRVEEIEETEVDEKGKEKKKKRKIEIADASQYARYIRKGDKNWYNDEENMKMFLNGQMSYLNDILHAKAYGSGINIMTLNEVYRSLGLEESVPGMVVGWIYDVKNPVGDNYIDISCHKVNIPDGFGHYEEAYLLDFNVDGNVFQYKTEAEGFKSRRSGIFNRDFLEGDK